LFFFPDGLLADVMCAAALTTCSSIQREASLSNVPDASQQFSDETSGELESESVGSSLAEFITQDVNGNEYTQDMFKDYGLTLINTFTTWCIPCVAEISELEKLYQQMKAQGVNVVGVVLDVLNEKGKIIQTDMERA